MFSFTARLAAFAAATTSADLRANTDTPVVPPTVPPAVAPATPGTDPSAKPAPAASKVEPVKLKFLHEYANANHGKGDAPGLVKAINERIKTGYGKDELNDATLNKSLNHNEDLIRENYRAIRLLQGVRESGGLERLKAIGITPKDLEPLKNLLEKANPEIFSTAQKRQIEAIINYANGKEDPSKVPTPAEKRAAAGKEPEVLKDIIAGDKNIAKLETAKELVAALNWRAENKRYKSDDFSEKQDDLAKRLVKGFNQIGGAEKVITALQAHGVTQEDLKSLVSFLSTQEKVSGVADVLNAIKTSLPAKAGDPIPEKPAGAKSTAEPAVLKKIVAEDKDITKAETSSKLVDAFNWRAENKRYENSDYSKKEDALAQRLVRGISDIGGAEKVFAALKEQGATQEDLKAFVTFLESQKKVKGVSGILEAIAKLPKKKESTGPEDG